MNSLIKVKRNIVFDLINKLNNLNKVGSLKGLDSRQPVFKYIFKKNNIPV